MADSSSNASTPPADPGQFVERETEDTRRLLQDRVARIGKYGQFVGLGFGALVTLRETLGKSPGESVEGGSIAAILCLCLVFSILWLVTRRSPLSPAALRALDAVVTVVVCGLLVTMGLAEGDFALALSPVMYVLLLRAVFLPSTAWRTLAVTVAGYVPLVVSLLWFRERFQSVPDAAPDLTLVSARLAFGIVLPTVVSHVIYGLRNELRNARRLGPYTLVKLIGEGGMGRVYRAKHAHLRRQTAIKILRSDVAEEKSLVRFEREVQATSQLTHPNTVVIYDYGRTTEGTFYYVMEYLEGMTLAGVVRRFGPQPPARVVHLLLQAAGSLQEAHSRGIIHRDIKPENLILCQRGGLLDFVKLLDFGLVKNIKQPEDVALTAPDTVMGTPLYIPPEAIHPSYRPDERTDIYALGAVGYLLLAGRAPFSGKNFIEISLAQINTIPERPSKVVGKAVSEDLEDVILSCLDKEPGNRPRNMQALQEMLVACEYAGSWTQAAAVAWWEQNVPGLRSGGRR